MKTIKGKCGNNTAILGPRPNLAPKVRSSLVASFQVQYEKGVITRKERIKITESLV
jgi:hypothetical protein